MQEFFNTHADKLITAFTACGAVLALLFAVLMARKVMKFPQGNEKMQKISASIRSGANAYLKRQYKVIIVFFAVMFVILGAMALLGYLTPYVPFAFLTAIISLLMQWPRFLRSAIRAASLPMPSSLAWYCVMLPCLAMYTRTISVCVIFAPPLAS